MEFTYAAALHITMASALFPNITESQDYIDIQDAYAILDQMVVRGNRLAGARKSELVQLETLFRELSARIERRGLETLILPCPAQSDHAEYFTRMDGGEDVNVSGLAGAAGAAEVTPLSMPGSPSVLNGAGAGVQASNLDFLDSIGISSYEFFSLVNQIAPESVNVLDAGGEWDGPL
jgi:proline utilization trans-activator